MSITFDNKEEAKEYIKQLISDGYDAYLTKKNGKYLVEKGDYIGKGHIGGIHFGLEDEDIIAYPSKSSTLERLHEFGHREYGHKGFSQTPAESIKREIEAEDYGRKKVGKELDYRYIENLVRNLAKEGFFSSASNMITVITKTLKERGYELNQEQKSDLWECLKELQKKGR